jgi:hypothetical protein
MARPPDIFRRGKSGRDRHARHAASLIVDATFALRDLALARYGPARLWDFKVAADIERGEFKEVLQGYTPPPFRSRRCIPRPRHLSPGGARFRRLGARYRWHGNVVLG